jgi:DNA-directed RNA polymerase subunit RPC12/RpoP
MHRRSQSQAPAGSLLHDAPGVQNASEPAARAVRRFIPASGKTVPQGGSMADNENRVLVQVCIECGKEYFFESDQPSKDMKCEKCGNGVFRSFYADMRPDDVAQDYADSTDRDVATNDPATDVTRGDLHDLNNI